MGEYSQASVLSEHWPGNSAIECRVRDWGIVPTPDLTLGRGSDPALFPWTGVHSLGSVYSEPEWWVIHPWLGLVASWVQQVWAGVAPDAILS